MMTGKGKYLKGRGGFFGRALGNLFGMGDLGDKLGDAAWNVGKQFVPGDIAGIGDSVFKFTDKMGRGLYRGPMKGRGLYAANNLVMDGGAQASNIVPQFNPSDLHTITYSNREFVRDVFAPAANTVFKLQSWDLNPGLATSFPYLAQLAINFEEYELVQLAYTFKSTISDFAANSGQVGQVIIATQYNPDSSPFATKDEMMLYEGGMSCKTTESMIHGIECDPRKIAGSAQKYVRAGQVPPTEDMKNYDLGKTSLAVVNAPSTYANQQIGELWVSYTVMLRRPKIASGNAYNVRRDLFVAPPSTITGGIIAKPSTLLACSRNSFGCRVSVDSTPTNSTTGSNTDDLTNPLVAPITTGPQVRQFVLTFPDDYSGVVRIRVVAKSNDGTSDFWVANSLVNQTSPTIIRYADIPTLVGGIAPTAGSGARIWRHFTNSTYSVIEEQNAANPPVMVPGGYKAVSDCELHLRLQPPTNGTPNAIEFYFASAPYVSSSIVTWFLEVTQMNSFLNVADNGSNDALDLVTSFSGQPAIYI